MSLLHSFLNSVAYMYYPKNMYAVDELFNEMPETKAYFELSKQIDNKIFKDQLFLFVDELKEKYPEKWINVNQNISTVPCYQIEIVQKKNYELQKVTTIFVSLLIPFYHLVNLTWDSNAYRQEKGKYGYSGEDHLISDYNFEIDLYEFLKLKINEVFNYNEFPREFLTSKIPEVFIHDPFEELNYFNAFYTDDYRISNAQYYIDEI